MKIPSVALAALSALVPMVYASPAAAATKCNRDNCARAATGTFQMSQTARLNACSSFQLCTVTPAGGAGGSGGAVTTVSVTTTVTPAASLITVPVTTVVSIDFVASSPTANAVAGRQASGNPSAITNCPTAVPATASPCSGTVRYASACSCAGVTRSYTTLPGGAAGGTTTVTFTVTAPAAVSTVPLTVVTAVTSQIASTCLPYAPGVLALQGWGASASSFCTSFQPITTVVVTATNSATTVVEAPASTVTADESTVTVTAPPETVYSTTVTVTAVAVTVSGTTTARQCSGAAAAKRAATSAASLPAGAPSTLSSFPSSYIASACECLHLPTPTSTTTTTVVESVTTTPVTTYTPVTTTTTTYTVTTASTLTVPAVVLAQATPLTTIDSDGLATQNYDDGYFQINLPFPLALYGQNSSSIWMGINGWISVSSDPKGNFVNTPLPAIALPNTVFSAYWSDLYVYAGTRQGLYYLVSGNNGTRTVAFEWYTSTYGNRNGYYHFIATFFENDPGAAVYDYYELTPQIPTTDNAFGTVGVQSYSTNEFSQYSFNNTAPVNPSSRVVYTPGSNSFTVQSCSS